MRKGFLLMVSCDIDNYDSVQSKLKLCGLPITFCELEGFVSGVMCKDQSLALNVYMNYVQEYLLNDISFDNKQEDLLKSILNHILKSFRNKMTFFEPTFPSDISLKKRAIVDWINSFLSGFGVVPSTIDFSKATNDLLKDLYEISQLDVNEKVDSTEEVILMGEVVEHIKVIISYLQLEFNNDEKQ